MSNGEISGTSRQSFRLEAMKIKLENVDGGIEYRTHENIGWMDWAKNGESAGKSGYGYRLEAIQIMIIPKGGAAPGLLQSVLFRSKLKIS
ncbi:hypothetical protein [Clostridium felsineum]|uniref:hypothetical protein n=1 Tax=Clostridium felsineum TaxID=36839 RepID=UPI00098CA9CA|nr:hypothetical protein [Clostridium felsineum]URZ03057.1 hypothetical protein CLAUR_031030 [Clostridium felsineum]